MWRASEVKLGRSDIRQAPPENQASLTILARTVCGPARNETVQQVIGSLRGGATKTSADSRIMRELEHCHVPEQADCTVARSTTVETGMDYTWRMASLAIAGNQK